jgi:hypothetical protein
LIGEGLEQSDLPLGERPTLLPRDVNHADGLSVAQHRHDDDAAQAGRPRHRDGPRRHPWIVGVDDLDDPAVENGAARNRFSKVDDDRVMLAICL